LNKNPTSSLSQGVVYNLFVVARATFGFDASVNRVYSSLVIISTGKLVAHLVMPSTKFTHKLTSKFSICVCAVNKWCRWFAETLFVAVEFRKRLGTRLPKTIHQTDTVLGGGAVAPSVATPRWSPASDSN